MNGREPRRRKFARLLEMAFAGSARLLRGAIERLRSPFDGLNADGRRALRKVLFGDIVNVCHGLLLVALGVTKELGPATTAMVTVSVALVVYWVTYHPPVQAIGSLWAPGLFLGLNMALNGSAFQLALRWVRVEFLQPLRFLFSAIFLTGGVVASDLRRRKFSTALWPILGLLGIWLLAADFGDGGGGAFTEAVPDVRVFDRAVPDWALGGGVLVLSAGCGALHNKCLERFDRSVKGQIDALARVPALLVFATVALTMEDAAETLVGAWPYVLICAVLAVPGSYFAGVGVVRAYEKGLRASARAMLSPLETLTGIVMGMLIARVAPDVVGVLGIAMILVAATRAAEYQSRGRGEPPGSE
ncbi:MAG TPA: hypothetical protein VIL71_22870 [Spirillospora sp.]